MTFFQEYYRMTMERLLNHYDKEYVKMAMLKHEETFREQVNELHRVYRIQKMLMKDMANRISSNIPGYNQPESEGVNLGIEYDEGDLELRLGPRSYYGGDNSSSTTGSSRRRSTQNSLSNPDHRLNSPPSWLFQAMTTT